MHKRLAQVTREAADKGRKAGQVFRNYYTSNRKPCAVNLDKELASMQKAANHKLQLQLAETTITPLRIAGLTLSNGLLIAMILKGLHDSFKPITVYIKQGDEDTFAELKTTVPTKLQFGPPNCQTTVLCKSFRQV